MTSNALADRDTVLGALDAIDAALDVLGSASLDGCSSAELLELLARREVIARRGPTVDHRLLQVLQSQARPGELGASTWSRVLAGRLHISSGEACRRIADAEVLGPRRIAYADFNGNKQYISLGNLHGDDRVSLFLMDYTEQRRLKLWGRARTVEAEDDPALMAHLETPGYRARIERGIVIDVEAFDWNCPKHITPRFTEAQIVTTTAPLRAQLAEAQEKLAASGHR